MTPVSRVLERLPSAEPVGNGWSARCPAHEDRTPSLSISAGSDGRALVKCFAGCKTEAVCAALGLRIADLMPTADMLPTPSGSKPNRKAKPCGQIVATYDYRDEQGELVYQVVRYNPKSFRQRRPISDVDWEWSIKGVRMLIYRLPEVLADPSRVVFVVEGEKDCDGLAKLGLVATCNSCGAEKWTAEHAEFLRGRMVVILPDHDEPGRRHAQQVAASLQGIAAAVRVVELPGLLEKGDASDWIATGGTKDTLSELIDATPIWQPPALPVEWPEIESLDDRNLPEFPTHALPDVLRRWVEAESHATQTPADLAGLLSLDVCAACVARRIWVEAREGWREPTNLFVAVLLPPGNRKSAVFHDATKPLREIEAESIEAARPTFAQLESERRQDHARLAKLEKQAADNPDEPARHDAAKLAAALAEQPAPVLPRLIVDDATEEKLTMILRDQGGRIASLSPEGGVFDLMAGQYSKSGVAQFNAYLKCHAGEDLSSDRVTRESVRVERPALTCGYAIQPSVIQGLADKSGVFRGRGLLARFLYAMPRSWIGEREIALDPVPSSVAGTYRDLVRRLSSIEGESVLNLDENATKAFIEWEHEVEAMLRDGGDMEILHDWGSKLAGAALRIAGILHAVEHGPAGRIDVTTISAAIDIAEYLIPHAEAVLELMEATDDQTHGDARYLLRWIERHDRREFSKRDAQQHGKRRFPKATDIDEPLNELIRRGYLRLLTVATPSPGRPPSPQYEVNPAFFAERKPNRRSRNSQKPAFESRIDDSGNIENATGETDSDERGQVEL